MGAISRKITRGAYKQNPGNPKLKAFRRKKELIDILNNDFSGEQRNNILTAYKSSLPKRVIDEESPSSIEKVVNNLYLPQQEDNYTPLEKFVGYLLLNQNLTNELNSKLNRWLEKNTDNKKQLIFQLEQEQEQEQGEQEYFPGLFVVISKQGAGYLFEASWKENIRDSSSKCHKLEQIQSETIKNFNKDLSKFITNFIGKYYHDPRVKNLLGQIRIFLPAESMNHPIDCFENWQEQKDEEYMRMIGQEYEVLLGCSERIKSRDPAVFKWRKNAQNLNSKLSEPASKIFVTWNSDNVNELYEQSCHKCPPIAVKIRKNFSEEKQPGTLIYRSGIPFAFWIRPECPRDDNQSIVLDEIIESCCLKAVPGRVKDKRSPSGNHIGRHLCLLWDDPNLFPPKQLATSANLQPK